MGRYTYNGHPAIRQQVKDLIGNGLDVAVAKQVGTTVRTISGGEISFLEFSTKPNTMSVF